MLNLVGGPGPNSDQVQFVEELAATLASPHVSAGLWLYVGDLERSHLIAQSLEDSVGSYWHGVIHRREGDFSNSRYWLRAASSVNLGLSGFDPVGFVKAVQEDGGKNRADLIELQRNEWKALIEISFRAGDEKPW